MFLSVCKKCLKSSTEFQDNCQNLFGSSSIQYKHYILDIESGSYCDETKPTVLQWCNLDLPNIVSHKILSTAKNVLLVKPAKKTNFSQSQKMCEYICGNLYFPSTLEENNEVASIAKEYDVHEHFMRISDQETKSLWKDPYNKEGLKFTNWARTQPDGAPLAVMARTGKWWDKKIQHTVAFNFCELTP